MVRLPCCALLQEPRCPSSRPLSLCCAMSLLGRFCAAARQPEHDAVAAGSERVRAHPHHPAGGLRCKLLQACGTTCAVCRVLLQSLRCCCFRPVLLWCAMTCPPEMPMLPGTPDHGSINAGTLLHGLGLCDWSIARETILQQQRRPTCSPGSCSLPPSRSCSPTKPIPEACQGDSCSES
jgi:hypothetical protein